MLVHGDHTPLRPNVRSRMVRVTVPAAAPPAQPEPAPKPEPPPRGGGGGDDGGYRYDGYRWRPGAPYARSNFSAAELTQ